jgi:hypothetical protein
MNKDEARKLTAEALKCDTKTCLFNVLEMK